MTWEEVLYQMHNEANTSRFPPYILDYSIEGETVEEFYAQKEHESVLEVVTKTKGRRCKRII